MTEAEWLTTTEPSLMMEYLKGKPSDRKWRLFSVACFRRIWHLLRDERNRLAIEVAEQFADGLVSVEELNDARSSAKEARMYNENSEVLRCLTVEDAVFPVDYPAADMVPYRSAVSSSYVSSGAIGCREAELWQHADLLRDFFGNPFWPITLNLSWLTSSVLALAQGIYDEKAFDRMPILADALQDAGCDNEDILNHCRQPGVHVKGCFVVDLVLEKQ